ncbi:MAG: protein-L-isoaspartate O-methyltransferase [Rhodospirillales bacterium]|nr:protein-L-isoaspartate O-methyltransferase [Rhodospirillales bacterium]
MVGAAAVKPGYAEARQNMVDNQLRANKVVDEDLIAVMGRLPREAFVPEHLRGIAYVDEDVALGSGRCLIEPMVLARLIQAAAVRPGDKVLVLGCATGYGAAVLAGLGAQVTGVDSDPKLLDRARSALAAAQVRGVTLAAAPVEAGYGAGGPYDVILIEGAVERVPPAVLGQLADGGRLVTVLAEPGAVGEGTLLQATRKGSPPARVPLFDAATPVLPAFTVERSFVF